MANDHKESIYKKSPKSKRMDLNESGSEYGANYKPTNYPEPPPYNEEDLNQSNVPSYMENSQADIGADDDSAGVALAAVK
jgi:hypothetical protein